VRFVKYAVVGLLCCLTHASLPCSNFLFHASQKRKYQQ
jgi:hypothetical protein